MTTQDRFPTEEAMTSIRQFFVITPQDDVVLNVRPKGIYVSATCDLFIKADSPSDPVVPLRNLAAGIWHPISPAIVMLTGTTTDVDIIGG